MEAASTARVIDRESINAQKRNILLPEATRAWTLPSRRHATRSRPSSKEAATSADAVAGIVAGAAPRAHPQSVEA